MPRNDLQCEWAFYGAKLDSIGMLYFRGKELIAKKPDILFFLIYTCHLLTDRKLTITGVSGIQKDLEQSTEGWLRSLNWEENRPIANPCHIVPYRGYSRSCMSTTMIFRSNPVFRSGRMGFGFFSNKRHLDFCSYGAVYSLLEIIYRVNSSEPEEDGADRRRRMNAEQQETMEQLFHAAALVHRLRYGQDLNRGNYRLVASLIYQQVTGDTYPPVDETAAAAYGPLETHISVKLNKGVEHV